MALAPANTEIVHEGWLVKSPPTKRIWRAKWRRRWFVLKHSGELPGQYFLEYYTDRSCRKLKGKIDLDQCEQVDSGLTIESRKQRYAHMFDIRTPKRVYFLAADSESDMNNWVGCICHVCGLKVFYKEDEEPGPALSLARPVAGTNTLTRNVQASQQLLLGEDTPPTSPISPTGSSGPYFHLSECRSGSRSLFFDEVLSSANQSQPSSAPVTPATTTRGLGSVGNLGTQSLRGKPRREEWDRFYDQPRELAATSNQPPPQQQPQSGAVDQNDLHEAIRGFEEKFAHSFKKQLPPAGFKAPPPTPGGSATAAFVPPPRPPKPPHLSDQPSHNYLNLDQLHSGTNRANSRSSSPSVSPPLPTPTNPDAWYDFPRSHQIDASAQEARDKDQGGHHSTRRHCYSNAAPGQLSAATAAEVFTFNNNTLTAASAAASAMSPSIYSNMASPFPLMSPGLLPMTPFSPPPSVNRTLKPKNQAGGGAEGVAPPPSVNRQLKPLRPISGLGPHNELHGNSSDDADDPGSRSSSRPNSAHDEEQIYYYLQGNQIVSGRGQLEEIQYLDLDLESDSSLQSPKSPERGGHHQHHSHHPPAQHHGGASSTVYKTVDFVKTEAFNRTRLTVEECRYKKAQ